MHMRRSVAIASAVAIGTAGAVAGLQSTSVAAGGGPSVAVVTKGLDDPFGLKNAKEHAGMLVAESTSGQVTRVFNSGRKKTILGGVPGVAGVAGGPNRVFAVIGGPSDGGSPSGGKYGPSRVLRMSYNGERVKVIANLLRYELRHNPDGQRQFNAAGAPFDALSNPFAMTWSKFGLFVADGGANDVLKINPATGKVRTFFAPRTFKDTKRCQAPDANANPGTRGCDPVPTGVDVVGNSLYVSFLGAEQPNAGRVYKLNARTGKVQQVWKRLTGPTGVAAKANGTVYVSHVTEGFSPGPGLDPATVGEITRIRHGKRTHAQVTMPTGLEIRDGVLYSTAWSVGSFLGLQHAGQVVKVKARAFK